MATSDGGFPTVPTPEKSDTFRLLHSDITSTRHPSSRPRRAPRQTGAKAGDSDKRDEKLVLSPTPPEAAPAPPSEARKVRPGSYEHLGLNRSLCQSLSAAGYNFPTPIQRKVIPPILKGHDVVAMARTGSGKTAAFLAPLIHRLTDATARPPTSQLARRNGPRILVVAPTRELVLQELKFARLYTKRVPDAPRAAVVVGGTPLDAQFEALAVCPEMLFATPGRLLQLLAEMGARRALTLSTVETLVLDEADRLFEGTLAVDTARLLDALSDRRTESLATRQTILVSATMPLALADFSRTKLRPGLVVARLDAERVLPPTLALSFVSARADGEKDAALCVIARRIHAAEKTCVVFAATHRRVDYLTELVHHAVGVEVVAVHGNMDQLARQDAVGRFRAGKANVLVVTDVAARGIDLPALDVVINYDAPATPKLFVHRVGRAGRAGRFGMAISLVSADEMPYVLDVHLFIGRQLQLAGENNDEENDGGEENGSDDKKIDAFVNNVRAMDTTFVIGSLPKSAIDEELETVRREAEDVEIEKLQKSARNAHRLYVRTRGAPSGESVRRAKALRLDDAGCRRAIGVHPWFADMESEIEKEASREVAKLSGWRPKMSSVAPPQRVLALKSEGKAAGSDDGDMLVDGEDEEEKGAADSAARGTALPFADADAVDDYGSVTGKPTKVSARQQALEAERNNFFMPTSRAAATQRNERALSVRGGGSMGDGLGAYRELDTAAMDVTADGDDGLLRSKHTGGTSAKFWDRVSKKFVKGGPTAATSKHNLHVKSREAMAKMKGPGTGDEKDGELFRKWLGRNRQTVQMLSEQAGADGRVDAAAAFGGTRSGAGIGTGDFRKGAFGRKARVAAAAREKRTREGAGDGGAGGGAGQAGPELKTADQIRKTRKLKAKAEKRRAAASERKGKSKGKKGAGGSGADGSGRGQGRSQGRGSSKVRVLVRGQGKGGKR